MFPWVQVEKHINQIEQKSLKSPVKGHYSKVKHMVQFILVWASMDRRHDFEPRNV